MPISAMSRDARPATSWPRNFTLPDVGSSTPDTRLNIVLLPAPLGPISATISPARTASAISFTATRPPKRLVALSTSSSTSPAAGTSRFASRGSSGRTTRRFARTGIRFVSAGHSPSGARCRITTISTPKTITSKLPACPTICGSRSCSQVLLIVITAAPSSAPQT